MEQIKPRPENKWILILIIVFHLVGITGMLLPSYQETFVRYVPFSLLFLVALLVYINNTARRSFLIFALGVFICAFVAEVFGVHAEVFGKYKFGETLGLKLAAVPLLMGVYFVILVYSVGQLIYLLPVRNIFLRSLTGSLLILIFDYFLEPAASKFNYWKWELGVVPYQNYIAWFVLAFVLLRFFYAMHLPIKKFTGLVLFTSQLFLFIAIYLWAL